MLNKNELYFDIETTGLGAYKSHLTVIGCAYMDQEPAVRQFTVEKPSDEINALISFCALAEGFDTLVNYNGSSFDVPYLRKKLVFYGLEDVFADKKMIDMYTFIRPLKKLLRLPDLKQKTLEDFLGIERKDRISGFECISCYRNFLETGDRIHLDKLLLHNREDVEGLLKIKKLEAYGLLLKGGYDIVSYESDSEEFKIRIALNDSLPKDLFLESGPYSLVASGADAVIAIRKYSGTLKFFFEDWTNYYYLPKEGRSVHKSVGQYVDRSFREKARRETAFEPVAGEFIPQPENIIKPCFYDGYKGNCFFRGEDISDTAILNALAESIIKSLSSSQRSSDAPSRDLHDS